MPRSSTARSADEGAARGPGWRCRPVHIEGPDAFSPLSHCADKGTERRSSNVMCRRATAAAGNVHECAPRHAELRPRGGRCVDTAARSVRFCIRLDRDKLARMRKTLVACGFATTLLL